MENTIYGMENVVANEVVKEENVMENQNVQAMEEVKVDNHEGMIRKFCVDCGKELWIPQGSRQTQCEECKAKKAQMAKEKMAERKAKENLVTMNITMRAEVKEALKNQARAKGMSIADFLKELLNVEIDEVKQEIA